MSAAYRVNLATMTVDSWLANVEVSDCDHYTAISPGFIWIPAARFVVATATPETGDMWDGMTPASFAAAAALPVATVAAQIADLQTQLDALKVASGLV